ncbi:hypothetical protein ODZ83_11050 [Acaricomes phytoseiuli]|uniref:hypothetical protein n=1 Tax=Acaricomes phytoseiuli TaxID=291968 RepID=UPI0003681078|nr:hypothetical protein [Acaricomes phytoseiuli]MCW1250698.1 hypothetical protein [Acaricomes phytoseiuli]
MLAASVAAPSASASPQPSSIKTTLTADAFEARINVIGEPTGNNVTITNTTSTSQISNVEVEILVSIEGRNDGDQTPLLIWTQQTPSNWSAPQDAGVATVNGRRVRRYVVRYQGAVTPGNPNTVISTNDLAINSTPPGGTDVYVMIQSRAIVDGEQILGTPDGFQHFGGMDPDWAASPVGASRSAGAPAPLTAADIQRTRANGRLVRG